MPASHVEIFLDMHLSLEMVIICSTGQRASQIFAMQIIRIRNCICDLYTKIFGYPHAMSSEYSNRDSLINLLPWLSECRAGCKECDRVPLCTQKLLMNCHFCMTTTIMEGRMKLHGPQVQGWGSMTHLELKSITFFLCNFVAATFLQGLFRFKVRRSSVFSLLSYSCSYSQIL